MAKPSGSLVDAQLDAANTASRSASKAYIILLVFMIYTGITVWSTTHEQLLQDADVTLPLLNVNVPIASFYLVVPWFLFILHGNLLVHLMLLTLKLRGLDDELRWSSTNLVEKRRELLRLDIFPITQWLTGNHESWVSRTALGSAYLLSVYALPVSILLMMQVRFLPAHRWAITNSQRWVVCVDLLCLWLFRHYLQPLNTDRSERLGWTLRRRQVFSGGSFVLCSFLVILFAFEIAVAPRIPSWWIVLRSEIPSWLGDWPETAIRSVPRTLELSNKTLVAKMLSPEMLSGHNEQGDLIDSKWLHQVQGLDMSRRDLRHANFRRSRLWNADLSQSFLQGVVFRSADLRGAIFTKREPEGHYSYGHSPAQLREADFAFANYSEGDLLQADLLFSDLTETNFLGSDLRGAKLLGVRARFAVLRGAALARIDARGADLAATDLRAADLRGADLQAADLSGANLQGADLRGAKLQGALLHKAKLQGADLREALVFGTEFDEADVSLADLRGIKFADPRADAEALIRELTHYRPYWTGAWDRYRRTLEQIRSRVVQGSEKNSLQTVVHQGTIYDPGGAFSPFGNPGTLSNYENKLASILVPLACNDVHITKGLLWVWDDRGTASEKPVLRAKRFEFGDIDPFLLKRSAALLDGLETRKCPVMSQLPKDLTGELREIIKRR
ncbi:MAG: pentapeptide repeat-containing protein [Nitrospira sp.]|nr:pentapeptide repeat-containing protein [Nitrospira sp.]